MAVSPAFHHWLHDDSEMASHQCAVTLLQQQQITPVTPAVDAPCFDFVHFFLLEPSQTVVLPWVVFEVYSSRAPPGVFVS
jgi:hypothetical protein